MLGDLGRRALAEDVEYLPLGTRALVNINNIPLKEGDCPTSSYDDIRYTDFEYYIKFKPRAEQRFEGQSFFIVADILPSQKLRFKSWEYLLTLTKKNKHLKWLIENTDLCKEKIDLAFENLNLPIRVNFDQVKHSNMLKQQIFEQTGEWPNYSMYREVGLAKADRARYEAWLEKRKKGASSKLDS